MLRVRWLASSKDRSPRDKAKASRVSSRASKDSRANTVNKDNKANRARRASKASNRTNRASREIIKLPRRQDLKQAHRHQPANKHPSPHLHQDQTNRPRVPRGSNSLSKERICKWPSR